MTSKIQADVLKNVNSSVDNLTLGTSGQVTVGGSLNIGGDYNITGSLTLGSALSVGNGGTGLRSLTAGYIPYASSSSALSFSSNLYSDGSNIGVGTNSPSYRFDVRTTTYTPFSISTTQNPVILRLANASGEASVGSIGDAVRFTVTSSATEAMRITSDGAVGIGETSPSTYGKLAVAGTIVSKSSTYATGTTGATFGYYTGGPYPISYIQMPPSGGFHIWDSTTNAKLVLDTSGNLGLGILSPGSKIDIAAGSGTAVTAVTIRSLATNSNGFKIVTNSSTDEVSLLNYYSAKLSFGTNNTAAMTLDASGNLVIGSSNAANGGKTTSVIAGNNAAITDYFLVGGSDTYRMCAFSEETSSNTFAIVNRYQGTGVISFRSWNGTAIAERIRINNSGNLSVGTNGGVGRIQASYGVGAMPSSLTAANSYLYLGGSDYGSTGNAKTAIAFGFTGNTATNAPAYLAYVEATTSGNTYGDFVFYTRNVTTDTAPTERVRIDYSGNLLVGNTSSASNYSVATFAGASKGIAIKDSTSGIYRAAYISSGNLYFWNGTNEGYLSSAGAWTNASDGRLKKNIVDIKYGLEAVLATMPRSFERKDVDGEYVGFIAQELQQIIPEVVSGDPNKQLGVDYGSLVAVAFKAIKELAAKVQALEAKEV